MTFKHKYLSLSPRVITCKCGRKIFLLHPSQLKNRNGGMGTIVAHAHCPTCRLEYHRDWGDRIYAHPYKPHENEAKDVLDKRT